MASLPAVFGVAVDAVGGAVVAEIVRHRAMVTGDSTPLFLDLGVPAASNQSVVTTTTQRCELLCCPVDG